MSVGLGDLYGVLEVDKEANDATIKKAYRKLVLQWHPDKHAEDRELAEEKIRLVNDAYETLSNPFKRSQYDQTIQALERKARGFMLNTTAIKPRMCIPKEFMLSPMGHPDKFVRILGTAIFVQSRVDVKCEFYDFFRDAKFSLWWLPEVNNMCRLRPTTTAGSGQDGGMNFNFALHRTVSVSEVVLSPGTMPDSTNVIAVASPVFQGAYRFEGAHFPGHYLAYKPPNHLRMVGGVVDETTAIDFQLVDYAKMFQYITADEVLMPAVTKMGGERDFVPLRTLRGDKDVQVYFNSVLKRPVWSDEDFEMFFESRSAEWELDRDEEWQVRLRSKREQLANSLRRSTNFAEVATSISSAGHLDVCEMKLDTLEACMRVLTQPLPAGASVSLAIAALDAQKKVLTGLPKACDDDRVAFKRLMSICDQVAAFGGAGDAADAKVVRWRNQALTELGEIVSDHVKKGLKGERVTLALVGVLCQMPLSWRRCSERLAKMAIPLIEDEKDLSKVIPLLRVAIAAMPSSTPLAQPLAEVARKMCRKAEADEVAEVLDLLVSGGLCLQDVPRTLERVLKSAPFPLVASTVAGLGERGVEGEDMRECAAFVGKERAPLEALPATLLLRLTVAATKSGAVAEGALDAVASAAAMTLPGWNMDDVSKLLLAVAKARPRKGHQGGRDGAAELYRRAYEVLPVKLSEFSSVQLIKVLLAIGQASECRPLMEAVALHAAETRLGPDLPAQQVQLLTQGLVPLGGGHAAVVKALDFWAAQLNEATRAENLLTESMGDDMVKQRRKDLEAKGQLSADQLAKLANTLAPHAAKHQEFWQALTKRFAGHDLSEGIAGDLTPAGKAAMEGCFPGGSGPEFEGKSSLLSALLGKKRKKKEEEERDTDRRGDRDRSRDGGRGASRSRSRGRRRRGDAESRRGPGDSAAGDAGAHENGEGEEGQHKKAQKERKKLTPEERERAEAEEAARREAEGEERRKKAAEEEEKRRAMRERRQRVKEQQAAAQAELKKATLQDLTAEEEAPGISPEEEERRRQQRERRANRKLMVLD